MQRRRFFGVFLVFVAAAGVMLLHAWNLGGAPRGFFVDEAVYGANAISVARSGKDIAGDVLPIFHLTWNGTATGPLFIDAAALLFRACGTVATVGLLRLTSVLFFALFYVAFLVLALRLFPRSPATIAFLLIAAGFLPWYFTLSRIAFDVITQPAFMALFFLFVHRAYTGKGRRFIDAALAGLFLGISVYTYPSARVLTFAALVLWFLFFVRRATWRKSAAFLGTFLASLVPYAVFFIRHPASMVQRFQDVTYLLDPALSVWSKMLLFARYYAAHFGPTFLLFLGDDNARHATHFGGQLFFTVFALAAVGTVWMIRRRRTSEGRFALFLFFNLLCAPFAAAMTSEGIPHALRSILLGFYFLVFAGYGFRWMATVRFLPLRRTLVALALLAVIVESSFFVHDYFTRYARESVEEFGDDGIGQAMQLALTQAPRRVVADGLPDDTVTFFFLGARNSRGVSLLKEAVDPKKGDCFLFRETPSALQAARKPSRQFSITGTDLNVRCF